MNLKRFNWRLLVIALTIECVLRSQAGFAAQRRVQHSVGPQIAQWTRFETRFTSSADHTFPVHDVDVRVEFTSPSRRTHTVSAFWDGDRTWKVRFSPNEPGKWTYRSRSSTIEDQRLNNQQGAFNCILYKGKNPLYQHGAIRLSANERYFVQSDNSPFFWLGDTAWNGPLKADATGWNTYLKDRAAKGFNVIKFVATQWTAATTDAEGQVAYTGKEPITINPAFYQRLDQRIDAINEQGLVAAPVLLWAHPNQPQLNPGVALSPAQMIVLARYMVARYGAHQVIWMLNGDGEYRGEKAPLWKEVGRRVFEQGHPDRLATMHPGQGRWMKDEFATEAWFNFNSYQSGHRDDEKNLRWLTEGPPSQGWKSQPPMPDINLEPSYEAHNSRSPNSTRVFDARDIRRAAYWSLLVAPPAGVSYGAHGIWSWEKQPGEPLNHKGTGVAPPWQQAIKLPGSAHMKHVKQLFASLEWWKLRPDQGMLAEQPGNGLPLEFIAAARSAQGDVGVIYIPTGGRASLKMDRFTSVVSAEWFNPVSGVRSKIGKVKNEGTHLFEASPDQDWVLVLRMTKSEHVALVPPLNRELLSGDGNSHRRGERVYAKREIRRDKPLNSVQISAARR